MPHDLQESERALLASQLSAAGVITAGEVPASFAGGADNHVLLTEGTDGDELIIKVPKTERLPRYALAAWAAGQLVALGVPTPSSVWHSERLSVETRCAGHSLADPWLGAPDTAAAAHHAGQLLRRIHTLPVSGYGRLSTEGKGEHTTAMDWLLRLPPAGPNHEMAALIHEVATALREHAALISRAPAHLLHGDWTARHALSEGNQITGVIDLESVRGGDPLSDVAGWSLQEQPSLTEALCDSYFPAGPDQDELTLLVLYRLRIAVFLVDFHSRRGDRSRARVHADQLAADLSDLADERPRMVPRIPTSSPPITQGETDDPHPR